MLAAAAGVPVTVKKPGSASASARGPRGSALATKDWLSAGTQTVTSQSGDWRAMARKVRRKGLCGGEAGVLCPLKGRAPGCACPP